MSFDVRTRLSQLKSSAKARNININLDISKYQALIDLGCFYCGNNLKNERGYCLDRKDSNKGYTITNISACCKECNYAKGTRSTKDFINWIEKVYNLVLRSKSALERHNKNPLYKEDINDFYKNLAKDKPRERLKVINNKGEA